MDQLLFSLLLLVVAPDVKPADSPTVVFAPDAWSDPPKNQDFKSYKAEHPDAASPDGPGTKAPKILPGKGTTPKDPGRVIAELYVDETGKLREIRVIRAQGEKFVEQSIHELKSATFKPGSNQGRPVAMCFAVNRWTEVR